MVEKFKLHLTVDKQIVSALSKQTYVKNFSYSIREVVSNAYDADALTIHINYDKKLSYFEIEDDGNGMTINEFKKFLTIAGTKNLSEQTRRYKRKRIGRFGVGFLSIFPFCESIEIVTTSENNDEVITATIPSGKFFDSNKNENITDILIDVRINRSEGEKQKHYTKIKLLSPTYLLKQQFKNIDTRKRDSIIAWKPDERLKWELQEDLPIGYNPDSKFHSLLRYPEQTGLNVFYNGKQIYRNELCDIVLENTETNIDGIDCNFILTTNYTSIKPKELRGIKIRVNNVGIGQRTDFYLSRNRGNSRLHWINGELYLSEKVKEQLNISREGFISNPIIENIYQHFADVLSKHHSDIEKISESEKELDSVINLSKDKQAKPKREIISAGLKKLESRGFEIIKTSKKESLYGSSQPSFRIDKKNKQVYVEEDVNTSKDYIEVFNKKHEVEYVSWDYTRSESPICRFKKNSKIIEINQSYPLFKSKSHGNIFKKVSVLMLVASENNKKSEDMFSEVTTRLLKEFKDLI